MVESRPALERVLAADLGGHSVDQGAMVEESTQKDAHIRERIAAEVIIMAAFCLVFVAYEIATWRPVKLIVPIAVGGALVGALVGRRIFGDWSRFIDSAARREVVRKKRDIFAWFMHGVGFEVLVLSVGALLFAFGETTGQGIVVGVCAGVVGWCAALAVAKIRGSS